MNLREALDRYPDLTPDERRQVDARVPAEAPELGADLAWMQLLTGGLGELRSDRGPLAVPDDVVAHLVASELVGGRQSRAVDEAWSYVRAQAERDGDLRARVDAARTHAERLERVMEDPAAQFERLSGHALDADAPTAPRRAPRRADRAASAPADRAAAPPRRSARRTALGRYALLACFVLVALYGGLGIASRSSLSELQQLGEPGQAVFDLGREQVFRGDVRVPGPDSNDARYREAVRLIGEARETTLGLFPRYDDARLARARALLEQVRASEQDGSFLHLEALYLLGKTMLLQEDERAAQVVFAELNERGTRYAEEVQRILAVLAVRSGDALPDERPPG